MASPAVHLKPHWKAYQLGLVPGPTTVPLEVATAYAFNFAASDLEPEFYQYYTLMQGRIQELLHTKNEVVFMTGEAMVTLWGALKSVIKPGDVVYTIGAGLFGEGFTEMAKALGATVVLNHFEWKTPSFTEASLEQIRARMADLKPKIVTAVHCETPCGSLNVKIPEIGRMARENGALFCVDAVSSLAGTPVLVDDWNIDIGLFGSQKALSCPPEFSFVSVSDAAWKVIEEINYVGYDALLPFKTAIEKNEFPYTPSWRSLAALDVALDLLEQEGIENVYKRHRDVQAYTMKRVQEMGLSLYLESEPETFSPTVTAVNVPLGWTWDEFNTALREKGLAVGGTYGKIAGQVFRIGHMGSQAQMGLLKQALDIIESVLSSRKPLNKV